MKDELEKFCVGIGVVVCALVIVASFILTPISFIYNWDAFLKTLFIIMDILFYIVICDLIYNKV